MASNRLFALGFGLACLVLTTTAFGQEVTAADRAEAKRLYTEARKLLTDGKPHESVALFRQAHELAPTPVTRLELARVLATQGSLLEARTLAKSVSELPVTKTETSKSKAARKDAVRFASELESKIPRVRLTFVSEQPAEQEVTVDGKAVSKQLLSTALELDPGDHTVVVRLGTEQAETKFKLNEGETRELTVTAVQVPPPPLPPPPVETAPPPVETPLVPVLPPPVLPPPALPPPAVQPLPAAEGLTVAVPLLLSIGGASLLAGGIAGAIAMGQASSLIEACTEGGIVGACARGTEADQLYTHEATAAASTALFVVGGLLATAGGVVWIVEAATSASSPSANASKLQLRIGGTTVALEGTW